MVKNREIVVCATSWEEGSCRRGIQAAGKEESFTVLRTGVGLEKAPVTLLIYLADAYSPSLIISTGFAGALTPDIPLYSWIAPDKVFYQRKEVPEAVVQNEIPNVIKCSLVSLQRPFRQGDSIPDILSSYSGPKAVDMESAALAEVAKQYQIPFLVLRFITDTPKSPLNDFICNLSDKLLAKPGIGRWQQTVIAAHEFAKDLTGGIEFIWRLRKSRRYLQRGWTTFAPKIEASLDTL